MNRNAEWCQRCKDALREPPLSPEEAADYEAAKAKEMAKREGKDDLFTKQGV